MYAAHAKKYKEESSQCQLKECLELVNRAKSDYDRFAALLEITHHVWAGSFIDTDRKVAVQSVDSQLLTELLLTASTSPEKSSDLYKSIVLSVLAALSVEPIVIQIPEIKSFISLLNDVISPHSRYRYETDPSTSALHKSMCRDCEEIVFNVSRSPKGIEVLVNCGTAKLLLDYLPVVQHKTHVLSCVGAVMQHCGDELFLNSAQKLNDAMSLLVEKFSQGSNLIDKTEYARILASFLKGFSLIEVSLDSDWVIPLAISIQKFILLKLHPDDSESVMMLVQALVSAVGPNVLDPQVTGNFQLLKAVIARVAVEVYMLLDNIDAENAFQRHTKLDGVYKLLSGMVQCAASLGEEADPDSVIAVYRKLLDIRDTIIEFLYSVANQELSLPRNHSVVLISVRALAAMLSEITEEPTPSLLKLLPFFNILCQPVEYADDVIMEVKNATQAALENIKMMGMNSIKEAEEVEEEKIEDRERENAQKGAIKETLSSFKEDELKENIKEGSKSVEKCNTGALNDADDEFKARESTKSKKEKIFSGDCPHLPEDVNISQLNGNVDANLDNISHLSLEDKQKRHKDSKATGKSKATHQKDISLSEESLEEFRLFQETVSSHRSRPSTHQGTRRVSFSSKGKKMTGVLSITQGESSAIAPQQPWTPGPEDVLRFLLPAYMFLVENEEALAIMVKSDSFHVIVSFLQKALSQLLEGKASEHPEEMITSALALVEQVHTSSPDTAARMQCFQDLFEVFMLSVPNLVNLPNPPPKVCLKLIETSLLAYRLQMMGKHRNASLTRVKHSQTRFFKAVVEYIMAVFQIRQHKRRPSSLTVAKHLRKIWTDIEDSWTSCLIGLSQLVQSVEELQEVLSKSSHLVNLLAFLTDSEASSLEELPQEATMVLEALLPLLESAASVSDDFCQFLLDQGGLEIMRKYSLRKISKHLIRYSKKLSYST